MNAPLPLAERLLRTRCPGCRAEVVHVEDVDTDEPIVVDPAQVDGGRITVWALHGHAYARRYGQPARLQPAWEEHVCPTPTVLTPAARPVFDPYEDTPAAAQQHGGWRS
ncbi:hypothetical protein [Blastococcus sp. CCUG 61487]|uniref:hypothetical protein n=1 Tax=Blastococcus sp. CCUG 61487 TaxID=1840703 RepID=UPI0010BFCAA2|nr:hypothetical protein [Blastococcus sp. CCUG 61487]TKJ25257.1 hypothetical protein A6V29_04345 [Blastococcus sp. CCUG 61487]